MGRQFTDAHYAARRDGTFVVAVAVACSDSAASCFCASMGTGPRPRDTNPETGEASYDLLLTEIHPDDPDLHHFVLAVGSAAGLEVAVALDTTPATLDDEHEAFAVTPHAATQQTRAIDTATIHDTLRASAESSR
ncbi:hypothetical protein [Demequina sp. NBRC 110053]|uniref:hypothetical protein n=1 Tax=Demequina sp. NBRC 110053 TaxID=1570342 RepID=UPI0009FF8D6A|nr:hypothetical protein [Demequina sp. NBRC 110053]